MLRSHSLSGLIRLRFPVSSHSSSWVSGNWQQRGHLAELLPLPTALWGMCHWPAVILHDFTTLSFFGIGAWAFYHTFINENRSANLWYFLHGQAIFLYIKASILCFHIEDAYEHFQHQEVEIRLFSIYVGCPCNELMWQLVKSDI